MHHTPGALLLDTAVYPLVRAASGRCSRAVDADTPLAATCSIAGCGVLRGYSRHRPLCSLRPRRNSKQGGHGTVWELRSRRSNDTPEEEVVGRKSSR